MIFAGIDIGKKEHGFAVIKNRNNKLIKPQMVANDIDGLSEVHRILQKHAPDKKDVVIGMEATGHYWRSAANYFKSLGYQVDVFNPLISSKREQQSVRGRKSDKTSAVAIAKVIRDDDYSVYNDRDENSEELKALIRQRSNLVQIKTGLSNRIIAYWDVAFPEIQNHLKTEQLLTLTGLRVLEQYTCAQEIALAHLTPLKNAFGRIADKDKVKAIRESAKRSIGLTGGTFHLSVMSDVRMFRHLHEEINTVEKQMKELRNSQCDLLQSLPGYGFITSAYIMAAIGDFNTFRNASDKPLHNRILAFAGADPRIRSSGKFIGAIKMSKRGDKHLRHLMFMAADSARKCCPYFKAIYDKQKQRNKHHYVAVSHVMRKMVIIAAAMLKNNEEFSLEKLPNFGVASL